MITVLERIKDSFDIFEVSEIFRMFEESEILQTYGKSLIFQIYPIICVLNRFGDISFLC